MSGLNPASGVAVVEEGGIVYAAYLPGGPIVVLAGIAAVIWGEAIKADASSIAERVASMTASDVEDVRNDVDAFVAELVERRLLVEVRP